MSSLSNWFNAQTLRIKLLISYYIILFVFTAPVLAVLVTYKYQSLKQHLLADAQTYAAIVADSTATAAAFADAKASSEALATLNNANEVIAVALLMPDNKVLATYHATPQMFTAKELTLPNLSLVDGNYIIRKPILLNGTDVGTIVMKVSTVELRQNFILFVAITLGCVIISLLLASWLASYLATKITKPLNYLIGYARRVADGVEPEGLEAPANWAKSDEIGKLSHSFVTMMSRIRERDLHLKELAFHDTLTTLSNRRSFELKINRVLESAQKNSTRCCLLFVDLDDFKLVNDHLGHDIGDKLLVQVAEKFRLVTRQNELVFRLGGDEFAVILEDVEDALHAEVLALRLISELTHPFMIDGHEVSIGASVGIASYPDSALNKTQLLSSADKAMYAAKAQGKNRYQRCQDIS